MTVTNLNIFQSGTLASVAPVNQNFETLRVAINSVEQSVNSNRTYLDGKIEEMTETVSNTVNAAKVAGRLFCVNSGHCDSAGYANIIYTSGDTLYFVTPFEATNIEGKTANIASVEPVLISGLADGLYNVFVDMEGVAEVAKNLIYRQPTTPSCLVGDVWLDTSKNPLKAKQYTSSGWEDFLKIPVGYFVKSGGAVTSVITHGFEQNGYELNANSFYPFPDYTAGIGKVSGVSYVAEYHGWLYMYGSTFAENKLYSVTLNGLTYTVGNAGIYGSYYNMGNAMLIPVSKGTSYSFTNVDSAIFFPVRIF